MNEQVNLTNCDREPIHIPGSVQRFGFLLALLSDFSICMASENAGDFLGTEVSALLQRPIADVFTPEAVTAIRTRVDYLSGPDAVERIFGLTIQPGKPPFDLAIHFSGAYLVVEAELLALHEVPMGWGVLVRSGDRLDLISKPVWQEISVEEQLVFIQRIAARKAPLS